MVATQELGDLGTNESEPVFIDWQWYYNVPGAMLASVLLLLALVPRRNRRPSAWLIFVVPLSIVGFFAFLGWLVPSIAELHDAGHFMTTLAMAWACVWLVGHWFGTGRLPRGTVVALGVMLAAGLVGYLGYFGFWFSEDVTGSLFGLWLVCSVPLVLSAVLTGICCCGSCETWPLVLWPMLWLPVTCVGTIAVLFISVLLIGTGAGMPDPSQWFMILAGVLGMTPFLAGILYILNLPVMLLCGLNPLYRERFQRMFAPPARPPSKKGNSHDVE